MLEALDVGGNNIDEAGIKVLMDALRGNTTLKTLELGYNPIGEKGAEELSNVLKYDLQVMGPDTQQPRRECRTVAVLLFTCGASLTKSCWSSCSSRL